VNSLKTLTDIIIVLYFTIVYMHIYLHSVRGCSLSADYKRFSLTDCFFCTFVLLAVHKGDKDTHVYQKYINYRVNSKIRQK